MMVLAFVASLGLHVLPARLEPATQAFARGDFDKVLSLLDGVMNDARDETLIEKAQLLRAQAFAATRQYAKAETALVLALEANPLASLDGSKVDPSLVQMLEGLRERLRGTVRIEVEPAGAALEVDGQALPAGQLHLALRVGRHDVVARWGGRETTTQVLVRPRATTFLKMVGGGTASADGPSTRWWVHPYAEARGAVEVPGVEGGGEIGTGAEFQYGRVGVRLRAFPVFGVAPVAAVSFPVVKNGSVSLLVYAEAALPVVFRQAGPSLALEGSAGLEFLPATWLGIFAQAGGRHYFVKPQSNVLTQATIQGGVRFRLPEP